MATKQWILFLLAAAMISLLAGCGGGSTANVQNPAPPPTSTVTIAFQPEPAGSLAVSFSENLTAVVTNDPNNYGVDWSLTCQNPGNCGSLSALHTASGAPTTYTAPPTLSTNSMAVEIVAFATANHAQNVVAPVVVTTFDSTLKGTYVLQAQGVDVNGGPNYQFAGVIAFDGNGNITSGEQTINFVNPTTGVLVSKSDPIVATPNSYFIGSDGRGTLTVSTGDDEIGGNGVETFTFVLLSDSQALISQMDFGTAVTGTSATGTMDLQTSTAAPSGGYAFAVSGLQLAKMFPVAFGGVFNIDSPNTISGNGSVADEILAKKVTATAVGLSGTLTSPDSFGAVTLNLTAGFGAANKPIPLQLTGYIVDNTHIKLIETDNTAGSAAPFGSTVGLAIGQGPATGTFTTNTSFSGTYVFGVPGVDLSNSNILPSTLTSVGLFTADGSGNLNDGFTDTFLQLNTAQGTVASPQTGAQISAPFTGTYSVDSTGTGRASSTSITFNPEPKHDYQPVFFFYLTGNGNPPLVLEGGDTHYPSVGAGIAYPQSANPLTFSGDYGFSFTQVNSSGENDGTAQMNANPTATPPSLSGFADVNLAFGATPDQLFTGSFSTPASNGVFPGALGTNNATTNNNNSSVFNPQIAVDYYIIDSGHGFFVETDLVNATSPEQPGQVSFGYYAVRTQLCDGCP
ncbi:MAG: hypothetical protein ABSA80_13480 [Terriglobales bacterium]